MRQVRALALSLAKMDGEGRLERMFWGPLGADHGTIEVLDSPKRKGRKRAAKSGQGGGTMIEPIIAENVVVIEEQEGWILGVT